MVKRKKPRSERRHFTPEFKAEAVRLCKVGDRSVNQVAAHASRGEEIPWILPLR
jgi:transposase-like protein